MTITDDEILEDNESYEVTLQRTSSDLDNRIILTPMTAEVNIIDDDSKLHTNNIIIHGVVILYEPMLQCESCQLNHCIHTYI